jgi:hypothetical protein
MAGMRAPPHVEPRRRALLAAVVVAAALVGVGCGGDEGSEGASSAKEGTYVGRVRGSYAYIALVSNGARVRGYLCDGKKLSIWFKQGNLHDESAKLASRNGNSVGTATFSGNQASGEITVKGKGHSFSTELARDRAGLYRVVKGDPGKPGFAQTGWVVLADRSVRGATNFGDGSVRTASGNPSGKVVFQDLH